MPSAQKGPIGTAILGTGMSLSVFHHPSISLLPEQFKLVSIYERTPRGRLAGIVKDGDGVKVVRTIEEVLKDSEVELVVVSTPNTSHYEYAKAALSVGKHVLVEKPLCPTLAEATELYDLAEKNGLILDVYQNRRWDSDFLTLKGVIASGKLGVLNEVTSGYDRYRPLPKNYEPKTSWKETPGECNEGIYNLGSHLIDQAVVLFGPPQKVGGRSWDIRGIGLEESFVVDLYYPPPPRSSTPLIVTLRASILSAVPQQLRYLIKGSLGSYLKYTLPITHPDLQGLPSPVTHEGFEAEPEAGWGELRVATNNDTAEKDKTVFDINKVPAAKGNYIALYENLHEAIRSGDRSRLEIKREQALAVLKIIELGLKSSKDSKVYSFDS